MNQGVHTVDLLVAALGTPVEVFAYTACLAHERLEVEDMAAAVVRFASGVLVCFTAPQLHSRGLIPGSRSMVIEDPQSSTMMSSRSFIQPRPHTVPATVRRRTVSETRCTCTAVLTLLHPRLGTTRARCRIHTGSSLKNFLAAIRGEEDIRVGLSENRTSISVILGAYESARTGLKVSLV